MKIAYGMYRDRPKSDGAENSLRVFRIEDSRAVDLSTAMPQKRITEILCATEDHNALRSPGAECDLSEIVLMRPIDDGTRVLCAGMNFLSHAKEVGREPSEHPNFFIRFPSSLVGPGEDIQKPTCSETLDWEGEVALAIGKMGRHIHPDEAMTYVAGYTLFGDHAVREYQLHGTQATAGKNFDRSGAIGPWWTTSDEVSEPADLAYDVRLNGDLVQMGSLSDLIHGIQKLISYLSTHMCLVPGDVIALGSPPGVGALRQPPRFLKDGDVIEIISPILGTLTNTVCAEIV